MKVWLAGGRAFGMAVYEELSRLSGVTIVGVSSGGEPLDVPSRVPFTREVNAGSIEASRANLIVCAQYYGHIPAEARDAAIYGAIGYHPSLLPRHRGPSAVEWTVAMRDPIAGGTVYLMDDGWDTGPIIAQDWCYVQASWNAKQLWSHSLFPMGVRLLKTVVPALATASGWLPTREQDERFATVEPKYTPELARNYELGYGYALGAI